MSKQQYALSQEFSNHLSSLEQQYNLPTNLLQSIAYTESKYDPNAKSPVGAQGMFQFMPGTAKRFNVNVNDPYSSADGAAKYLSYLYNMFDGNLNKTVAAYNWGEGNVQKKGLSNPPTETKNYIAQVNDNMNNPKNPNGKNVQIIGGNTQINTAQAPTSMPNYNDQSQSPAGVPQSIPDPNILGYNPSQAQAQYQQQNGGQQQSNVQQQPKQIQLSAQSPAQNQIDTNDVGKLNNVNLDLLNVKNDFNTNDDKLNKELQAYKEYQQYMQTKNDSMLKDAVNTSKDNLYKATPQEMQAYQEYLQSQSNQQTTPAQNSNNAYANLVQNQQDQSQNMLAQQQAQQAQAQQNQTQTQQNAKPDFNNAIYQKFLNAPNPIQLYVSLNPNEQRLIDNLAAQDAQKNAKGQMDSNFKASINGLAEGARESFINPLSQAIAHVKTAITGNQDYVNQSNQQIKLSQAADHLNDIMDPNNYRTGGKFVMSTIAPVIATGGLAAPEAGMIGLAKQGAALGLLNTSNPDSQNYVADKLVGAGFGAVAAPVTGAILNKTVTPLVKSIAQRTTGELPAAAAASQELALNNGYKPLASELSGATPEMQKTGQNMAFKNSDVNAQSLSNATQAKTDIENLKQSLTPNKQNFLNNNKNITAAAADEASPYNSAANSYITKLNNADENNVNQIFKTTAEGTHLENKIQSSNLYDKAAKLAPENVTIEANNAKNVLDNIVKDAENTKSPSLQTPLNNVVKNLSPQLDQELTPQSFNQAVKEVTNLQQQAYDAGDQVSGKYYTQFKNALTKDQDNFVNNLSDNSQFMDYKAAYNEAKQFNAEKIQSINNDPTLSKIFNSSVNGTQINSDNMINDLVKKGQTTTLTKAFNALDQESQNAIQQGVLNNLLSKSTVNDNMIDPQKFYNAYQSYANPVSGQTPMSVIFGGQTKARMDDLLSIYKNLNTVKSALQNPQNGIQNSDAIKNLGVMQLISSIHNPAAFIGNSLVNLKNIFSNASTVQSLTNPAYQKMFFDLKNTNPNTAKYLDVVNNLLTNIASNKSAKVSTL